MKIRTEVIFDRVIDWYPDGSATSINEEGGVNIWMDEDFDEYEEPRYLAIL